MPRKYWLILILGIVTTCSVASAQSPGLSYLAMCNPTWECGQSIAAFKGVKTIRTGWLEGSFGNACKCADALLRDKRPKEVRIHLANGPCMRNRRCGRHEVFHGYTVASANRAIKRGDKKIIDRFQRVTQRVIERLAKSRGPLTCYVSPVLESDNDIEARKILHRLAGAYLPNCTLVDNPLRGKCLRGAVCERHGPTPGLAAPCIADLDGSSARTNSVASFMGATRDCDMSLIWTPELNCNEEGSTRFVDPSKRNCAHPGANWGQLARWLNRSFR